MSASRKTNGKQKAGGSPSVIKTYHYTGSDKSINTLRRQAKRWSGGKVTWRIVPDDPQKYTLMGTPGNCVAFHAGVKQLCDESNSSKKGKGREFRSESQTKQRGKEYRRESQNPPPRHRQGRKETRRRSVSPPPRHRQGRKETRRRSVSPPPRHRQGRKEERRRSVSPPPRHRQGSKETRRRSVSPPPRHRQGSKETRRRSVSPPPRHRGMHSNPYAPQREVGNFKVGALSENVESITITTVTYKFVSKPRHTNPHTDIGSDEWMKWELDWDSGYC